MTTLKFILLASATIALASCSVVNQTATIDKDDQAHTIIQVAH